MKSLSLLENVAKIPLFCKIMVDLLEGECEALLLSSLPPSSRTNWLQEKPSPKVHHFIKSLFLFFFRHELIAFS